MLTKDQKQKIADTPKYPIPDKLEPQLKTREARRRYIERKDVQRWIKRNARGLRVIDIRHFHCTQPGIVELAEIYHVVKMKSGKKRIRVRVIFGDPPPLPVR